MVVAEISNIMDDLEEGEIPDESSPIRKKNSPVKNRKLSAERTIAPKKRKNSHICKNHRKTSVKKDEGTWFVKDMNSNMTCSKSFQDERTVKKKKVSLSHMPTKKHEHKHSSDSKKSSKPKEPAPFADVNRNSTPKNNYFRHTSSPPRFEKAFHSKVNSDMSFEDMLDQYKTIQLACKNLPKAKPSPRTAKFREKVYRSDSVKGRRSTVKFKSGKVNNGAMCNSNGSVSKSVSPKQKKAPSENKNSKALTFDFEEDDYNLEQLRQTALLSCAKLPPSPVKLKNTETASSQPVEVPFIEDNYEVVDMEIYANEGTISNEETSQDNSVTDGNLCEVVEESANDMNVSFMDDNYEVLDMEVSDDETSHVNPIVDEDLQDVSIIEIPRSSKPAPELIEIDMEEEDDDEEVLRAQLILSLKRSKLDSVPDECVENGIADIKNEHSTDNLNSLITDGGKNERSANSLISLTDGGIEVSVCCRESSKSLLLNKGTLENVPSEEITLAEEIRCTVDNMSEAVAAANILVESMCETVDNQPLSEALMPEASPQDTVAEVSKCTVVVDTSVNVLFKGVPNVISEENSTDAHLGLKTNIESVPISQSVVNIFSTTESLKKVEVASKIIPVDVLPVPVNILSNGVQEEQRPVQQTISVTCRSDNLSSRQVHITKRKPISFLPSKPIKPFIIHVNNDSSESESDEDESDSNILALPASLERLIESAKNKSETLEIEKIKDISVPLQKEYPSLKGIVGQKESVQLKKEDVRAKFNEAFSKLNITISTYQKEAHLYNGCKMNALKRKSAFVASQSEVARLREQLIMAERIKNSNQKLMFEANSKVANVQKNMMNRKGLIEKLKAECAKKGIELFGPNYVLPKNVSSPFGIKTKPS